MSSLAEGVRELSVSVMSPRGRAKVTLTERRTSVVIRGRSMAAAPERELAEELTAAWRQALRQHLAARERLRLSIRGPARREPVPEVAARLQERREIVEAIDVDAQSPAGIVRVRRIGSTWAEIRIRPESLSHVDDLLLRREVEAAIEAVNRARLDARAGLTAIDTPIGRSS